MSSKDPNAKRIAHMVRHLPKTMKDVRDGTIELSQLPELLGKLKKEREFLKQCVSDFCEYLGRKNCTKEVDLDSLSIEQAKGFIYVDGCEAQDFMFVDEFYMYSKYEQKVPEELNKELSTGIALLYACIYYLSMAIAEVKFSISD